MATKTRAAVAIAGRRKAKRKPSTARYHSKDKQGRTVLLRTGKGPTCLTPGEATSLAQSLLAAAERAVRC